MTAARSVAAALRRALGKRHPHGWTLQEELLIVLMRTLLSHGDINVWRSFFRHVSAPSRKPPTVTITPVGRPGSRSVWFTLTPELRPRAPRARLNLLFIHGGAFAAGSSRQYQVTYDIWLKELAKRGVEAKILSVAYPLAPTHPFPAARDACEAEIAWLLDPEASGEADPVIVGGDSAGGNLAIVSLAHMRDAGRLPSPPAGVLLISPCTDMSPGCVFLRDDAEARAAGEHDYLPREKLGAALPTAYAPDLTNPYVSPALLPSYAGVAARELMTVAGSAELMVSDIRRFAKRVSGSAAASGGAFTATYHEEPGRVHSWPLLVLRPFIKASAPIFDFMERVLGL